MLVRGKVEFLADQSALIRIPALAGGHRKVEVPNSEIFAADHSTNGAYEATRAMIRKSDQFHGMIDLVEAEIEEAGSGPGSPAFEAVRVLKQYADQHRLLELHVVSELNDLGLHIGAQPPII